MWIVDSLWELSHTTAVDSPGSADRVEGSDTFNIAGAVIVSLNGKYPAWFANYHKFLLQNVFFEENIYFTNECCQRKEQLSCEKYIYLIRWFFDSVFTGTF